MALTQRIFLLIIWEYAADGLPDTNKYLGDIRFVLIIGPTHWPHKLYFLYITDVEAKFADMY